MTALFALLRHLARPLRFRAVQRRGRAMAAEHHASIASSPS